MIKKQQQFIPKGMNQDIAETKVQSEFAHSIKNLRVVTDEKDGTLSLVTEKGTALKSVSNSLSHEFFLQPSNVTVKPLIINSSVVTWSNQDSIVIGEGAYLNNEDLNLNYKTKITIVTIEYTFSKSIDIDHINYNENNYIKYFTLDGSKFKTNINLSDSAELNFIFKKESGEYIWKYKVTDVNGVELDDVFIDFNDSISNETLNSYHLWEFTQTSITDNGAIVGYKVTVNVPVIDFTWQEVYDTNLNLINFISDGQITYPHSYGMYIVASSYKEWKCVLTDTISNILGTAIINKNKNLILFTKTTGNKDAIVKIQNFTSNDLTVTPLYIGNLNFNVNNPIKTYVSYENEKTIKVYWIDGLNQPRVINVAEEKTYELFDEDLDNHFDFCTHIYCKENVTITKNLIGGFFHSGIIQYFMTYVDQNDQESKIFYQSPLYYITDSNRALSPDEVSTNSFLITVSDINSNNILKNKLRIYSLQRTSLDSVPIAKLVYELKLNENTSRITITDTGNIGYNIDPQVLLSLGCEEFIPQTFTTKDQTMFFGNIKTENNGQADVVKSVASSNFQQDVSISTSSNYMKALTKQNNGSVKEFMLNGSNLTRTNELEAINRNGSDNDIKGFMYQEEYMLGIQFLHKSGEWSEPIWVCDKVMSQSPISQNTYHEIPFFYASYSSTIVNKLIKGNYIAARPLVVFNDYLNARVLCCGVLNSVIKYNNVLMPSWFFRPLNSSGSSALTNNSFSFLESAGNDNGSYSISSTEVNSSSASNFKIMGTWKTFNSPELEFEKINKISDNYKLYTCADIKIDHLKYDIEMMTSTSTENLSEDCGFKKKTGTIDGMSGTVKSSMTFVGGSNVWIDKHTIGNSTSSISTQIYPWHNNVSYSGNLAISGHNRNADLVYGAPEKKTISNWRMSNYSDFYSSASDNGINVANISVVNESSIFIGGYSYTKDVDLLVVGGNSDVGDVRIQYKSTPHVIMKLDNVVASAVNGSLKYCYLLNKSYDSNKNSHFKGRLNGKPTETSMYENTWYIAGDTVKLIDNRNITIKWTKGDTYYQRYNCLKTYPFSHEAKNSIIDICSFMVQTRINIDGTYDKQKTDILHIEPENFNKLNDVYSQMDNFFTYRKLDPDKFQNTFPNLVTWSKQKVFGESIDSWTNIHLTNVLDLDGNLGEVTALKLWNNKLIAFQNKGISVIKYNENVAIPQSVGAPIVLMNSGLVNGKEYLTNQFGCQNEWSITNAKSGLYFSDDYNHKLYVLSDGIKCISDNLGFKSYLKTKNYSGVWNPERGVWNDTHTVFTPINTLRTYYDQQLGEIYFTDGTDCLTFNENLNLFTSFYDYVNTGNNKLFDFVNIENKNYWILNNFTNNTPAFYEHRAIDNLNIFGVNRGYSIELTSNIDPHLDKVFDTVEIRGDAYISDNLQSGYGDIPPFDKLRATNEYQDSNPNEESNLTFNKDIPSNVKQKFRIWRIQIGRNQKQLVGENIRVTRDRIRNVWSRIKLIKTATSNLKAKIHDIIVNVYE